MRKKESGRMKANRGVVVESQRGIGSKGRPKGHKLSRIANRKA